MLAAACVVFGVVPAFSNSIDRAGGNAKFDYAYIVDDQNNMVADLMDPSASMTWKAGDAYKLKYKFARVDNAGDAWVSITLPYGLQFKDAWGMREGRFDSSINIERDSGGVATSSNYENLPAVAGYQAETGTITYQVAPSFVSLAGEVEIVADTAYINSSQTQELSGKLVVSAWNQKQGEDNATKQSLGSLILQDDVKRDNSSRGYQTAFPDVQKTASMGGLEILANKNVATASFDVTYPEKAQVTVSAPGFSETSRKTDNGKIIVTYSLSNPWKYDWRISPSITMTFPATDFVVGSYEEIIVDNVHRTVSEDASNFEMVSEGQAVLAITVADPNDSSLMQVFGEDFTKFDYPAQGIATSNELLGRFYIGNRGPNPVDTSYVFDAHYNVNGTAGVVKAVSVPYTDSTDSNQSVSWEASNGASGTIPMAQLQAQDGLVKNVDLGLDPNVGITRITYVFGIVPANWETAANNGEVYTDTQWGYQRIAYYGEVNGTAMESKLDFRKEADPSDGFTATSIVTPANDLTYYVGQAGRNAFGTGWPSKNAEAATSELTVGYDDILRIEGQHRLAYFGAPTWGGTESTAYAMYDPEFILAVPQGMSLDAVKLVDAKVLVPNESNVVDIAEIPYTLEDITASNATGDGAKLYKITVPKGMGAGFYTDEYLEQHAIRFDIAMKVNYGAPPRSYQVSDLLSVRSALGGSLVYGDHSMRPVGDKYDINGGEPLYPLCEGRVKVSSGNTLVNLSNAMKVVDKNYGTDWITYDPNNADATTAFVNQDSDIYFRTTITNDTGADVNGLTMYVPLPKAGVDLGEQFSDGAFQFSLTLTEDPTEEIKKQGFTVKFVKIKQGVKFDKRQMPQPKDYDETTWDQCDMGIVSYNGAFAVGESKTLMVHGKVGGTYSQTGLKNIFKNSVAYSVTGGSGALQDGVPVGIQYASSPLKGYVFEDVDEDGVMGSGDTPLSGVELEASDGVSPVGGAVTGQDGSYEIIWPMETNVTIKVKNPDSSVYKFAKKSPSAGEKDNIFDGGTGDVQPFGTATVNLSGVNVKNPAYASAGLVRLPPAPIETPTVDLDIAGKNPPERQHVFRLKLTSGDGTAVQFKNADGSDAPGSSTEREAVCDASADVLFRNAFGNVQFMKRGSYEFEIAQIDRGTNTGWTLDTASKYTWKITVDDQMKISQNELTDAGGKVVTEAYFANSYQPLPLAFSTVGYFDKALTGRDWSANDRYEFEISATSFDGAGDPAALAKVPAPQNAEASVDGTGGGSSARAFDFGSIEFVETGTYGYAVTEKTHTIPNVDRDNTVANFTIAVSDVDGQLQVATGDASTDYGTFENRYASELDYQAAGGLTVKSTLDGRNIQQGALAFSVTPKDADSAAKFGLSESANLFAVPEATGSPATSSVNVLDGKDIKFTHEDAGNTYEYQVQAQDKGALGYTYDTAVRTVKVSISDDGAGKLTAVTEISGGPDAKTYTYSTGDAPATDVATIVLDHSYKAVQGVYDTNFFQKSLTGRAWSDGDSFGFTLAPRSLDGSTDTGALASMPLPGKTQVDVAGTPGTSDAVYFGFGSIAFDHEGEYVYGVTEDPHSVPGVLRDTHEALLAITVSDVDGQLTATHTMLGSGEFENQYSSELDYSAAGGVTVSTVLEGRDIADGQFSFTVTPIDAESAAALGLAQGANSFDVPAGSSTGSSPAASPVALFSNGAPVKFTHADAGKTYGFKVVQANGGRSGYVYDTVERTVTIEVTDNGDGSINATTTVAGGPDAGTYVYTTGQAPAASVAKVTLTNRYETTDVGVSVIGSKTLDGRQIADGEFSFSIAAANDASKVLATGKNDASGAIAFSSITFNQADLDQAVADGYATLSSKSDGSRVWTVHLQAWEATQSGDGVTADDGEFFFSVEVTDAGAGSLAAAVQYPANGLAFTNTYSAGSPVGVTPHGGKVFANVDGLEPDDVAGKFSFALRALDGGPMPSGSGASAANDELGNVVFGELMFEQDLLADVTPDPATGERSRTFEYEVTETGSAPGVTNEGVAKKFSLTLVDFGDGTGMDVSANPAIGSLFTFTNVYDVASSSISLTDQLGVSVELSGRPMVDSEFAFELSDVMSRSVVSRGVADGSGAVAMSPISFDGPGEHSYVLRQVPGEAGAGVTYDDSEYRVHASVQHDGKGGLTVSYAFDGGDNAVTFKNVYAAAPVQVELGAAVVLQGRDLSDGQFVFLLGDRNGTVARAANAPDGSVVFAPVTLEAPGTYRFTVSQVDGGLEGYTYDTAVHEVVVEVADDLKGHLQAAVAGKAPLFVNSYEKPADVPEDKPGDVPGDKPGDQPSDKPADKPADQPDGQQKPIDLPKSDGSGAGDAKSGSGLLAGTGDSSWFALIAVATGAAALALGAVSFVLHRRMRK